MKGKSNNGISLVVLIVTIVMMIILASTAIVKINVSSNNSRLSVFTTNVSSLEENVKAKYVLEQEIPHEISTSALTMNDVKNMVSDKNKELLELEFAQNGESDSSIFYILDVADLGADKLDTGVRKLGTDDIYVVSANTLKVYYLYGIKYKNTRYFSINGNVEKIVTGNDNTVVEKPDDTSVSQITTYQGIKLHKNNAVYTNELAVKLETTVNSGEELKIGFNGITNKKLKVGTGNVTVSFNSLKDLNSQNILDSNFTSEEISKFNKLPDDNKKIYVYKYSNSSLIATYDIDVSNFDDAKPTISNTSVEIKDTFSLIKGSVADSLESLCVSGVSQVRYEYLLKLDGSSNYGIDVNDDYMKNKAKKIVLDNDGNFGIKIPLDVAKLELAVIDNAGNYVTKTIEVTNTIENVDILPPVVVATGRNEVACKNKDIKIMITDKGGSGLASDNVYEYQLTNSDSVAPDANSGWKKYTNNATFNIGSGLTGTYYLWVKEIKDNKSVVSVKEGKKVGTYHMFGKYDFDNSGPKLQNINIVSPNSGFYPAGTNIKIDVTFDEEVYSNDKLSNVIASNAPNLNIKFGDGKSATFKNAKYVSCVGKTITYEVTIENGDNDLLSIVSYNGILYDRLGNKSTINYTKGSNDKISIGNEIKADTISPSVISTPNGGNYVLATETKKAKLKPVVSVSDAGSGVRDIYYMWSNSSSIPSDNDPAYKKLTNNSEAVKDDADAGTWYLYVKTYDKVGNKTVFISEKFVVAKETDGNGDIKLTPNIVVWTNTDVIVTATYGQNLVKEKTLTCTGTLNTDYTIKGLTSVTVKSNNQTVRATAKDGFGNMVTKSLEIANIDKEPPIVTVSPSNDNTETKEKNITISVSDTGGSELLASNKYEYQWSESDSKAPTGAWQSYTNGATKMFGTNYTNVMYLWVRRVKDVAGSTSSTHGELNSSYHVFGPYQFRKKYYVTYDKNGHGELKKQGKDVIKGESYGELPVLSEAGYDFLGWFTAPSGGTQITENTTVTADAAHTLYAHWKPKEIIINYDKNNGVGSIASQTKIYDQTMYLTKSITSKEGYTFSHWNTEANGNGTSYRSGQEFTNSDLLKYTGTSVTLYAIYKDITNPECTIKVTGQGCQAISVEATAKDKGSGIAKIEWFYKKYGSSTYISSGVEGVNPYSSYVYKTHAFTGLNDNTSYELKIRATDKDGNYAEATITEATLLAVCQNQNGVKYTLIANGFKENKSGTITMIRSTIETATLPSEHEITFNLNGKTVTGADNSGNPYTIQNSGKMIITGDGKIVSSSKIEYYDAVVNNDELTIKVTGTIRSESYKGNAVYNTGGNTTIESGTFEATNAGRTNSGTAIVKQSGTASTSVVTINGGTFKQEAQNSICIGNSSTGYGKLRITGGTFTSTQKNSDVITSGDSVQKTNNETNHFPHTVITGGTFTGNSEKGSVIVVNYGTTEITGGKVTNNSTGNAVVARDNTTLSLGTGLTASSSAEGGTIRYHNSVTYKNSGAKISNTRGNSYNEIKY